MLIREFEHAALPNAEPLWPAVRPGRLRPALAADEVHVWSMSLSRPAWPIEELAGWLDADETVRAARFHFEKHHQRFVTAHGLMRGLLSVYAGLVPAKLRIAHAANGKPSQPVGLGFLEIEIMNFASPYQSTFRAIARLNHSARRFGIHQ